MARASPLLLVHAVTPPTGPGAQSARCGRRGAVIYAPFNAQLGRGAWPLLYCILQAPRDDTDMRTSDCAPSLCPHTFTCYTYHTHDGDAPTTEDPPSLPVPPFPCLPSHAPVACHHLLTPYMCRSAAVLPATGSRLEAGTRLVASCASAGAIELDCSPVTSSRCLLPTDTTRRSSSVVYHLSSHQHRARGHVGVVTDSYMQPPCTAMPACQCCSPCAALCGANAVPTRR